MILLINDIVEVDRLNLALYWRLFTPTHRNPGTYVDRSCVFLGDWYICHWGPLITGYSGPNGSGLAAFSMLASAGSILAISPISVVIFVVKVMQVFQFS